MLTPPGPRIGWQDAEGVERSLELQARDGPVAIGRREDNTIALPWDLQVSRVHAVLEHIGSDWTVRDDGLSRNGTWVNGERVRVRRRLSDGDVIRVGGTLLIVHARAHLDSVLTIGADGTAAAAEIEGARTVIKLCGPLTLEIDGRRREDELSGRKGRRLFAHLVMHRSRAVRRDELTELLWPRERPKSPEDGLNVHLARLRAVLGKDALVGRGELRLELGESVAVDTEQAARWQRDARRQLTSGDPSGAIDAARAALNVLQREFLPGFDDDEWVRRARIELEAAIPVLLEIEAEAALSLQPQDLALAETAANSLIALRPYRESDHRILMRVHLARGNTVEALLAYESLRERLMAELGLPPAPETRALYEHALTR